MLSIIILAIIQALTEFIPVSSSGHLLAVQELTSLESSLALDVILHLGTLLAILVFFKDTILGVCKNPGENRRLIKNVVITSIPAALTGFALSDFLKDEARALPVVIVMLFVVGLIMIFSDKLFPEQKNKNKIDSVSNKDAAAIGLGQALALIPGTSRSGITILAARARGLNNSVAAEYSFLAGVPVIAGAALKTLLEEEARVSLGEEPLQVLIGVLVAFGVGYVALKFLLSFVQRRGLAIFGYYRLALAAILFILLLNQ